MTVPAVARRRHVAPRTARLLGLGPVAPVAVIAVATLWWPESGDQALFVRSAQTMRDGGVYYRDVWDIKQPGLYWFYELGDLVVPGGLGTRLLEALLAVVAAVLVLVVLRDRILRPAVVFVAPTIVLGPYLVWSAGVGVGQVEGLMNVLVLLVLAATWPSARRRPAWCWFVAGLAVGAIVLLKTLYGPIPLVVLVFAAAATVRADRRGTLVRAGAALAGALVPVAAAVAYLAGHGVLDLALATTFELPSQVVSDPALRNAASRLQLQRGIKNMFPVVGPLAVLGLVTARRRGDLGFHLALAATAATAFALALPQLWTTYRWLMLAAPVGLMATSGLEAVLSWLASRRAGAGVLALRAAGAVAVVGLTLPLLRLPFSVVTSGGPWGLDPASRIARGEDRDPVTHPGRMAALVADRIAPGTQIFVLGDPRITVLLDAVPATQIAGWAMPGLPAVVWDELYRELVRSHPRLVFVDGRDWSAQRSGVGRAVFDLVENDYQVLARAPEGTWYQTR